MMTWKPVDLIVLILAASVSLILLGIVYRAIFDKIVLDEARAKLMAGMIGSLLAIISMYVGAKLKR